MLQKQSFRARHPSEIESSRCETKAVVRDFPQKLEVEIVKTELSSLTALDIHCSGHLLLVILHWC